LDATSKETAEQTSDVKPVASGDSTSCEGESTPDLVKSLEQRGVSSRACFTALLRRGTEARGQVKVGLVIAKSGLVEDFNLSGDDPGDLEFTECLANHFRSPFAETPPDNGCLSVKIPLNFSVKKSG
jgi:hypothetical protein